MRSVSGEILNKERIISTALRSIRSCGGSERPNSDGTCPRTIMSEAAQVNPTMTEFGTNCTMNPSLNTLIRMYMMPISRTSVAAMRMYASEPGVARGTSEVKVRRLMTATGPVERWRDEPQSAAIQPGIEAYKPYCGGSPAMSANAIDCGTCTSATVVPAT